MPAFDEHYSDTQRDAIASAWNDRGIRPAARIAQLAKAGELLDGNGEKVPGFGGRNGKPVPEGTIRSFARHARRRRRGELVSALADAPPRDSVETLRRRLINMADAELGHLERQRNGSRDPERMRQVARAVLEIARLPGPTDPRPPSPDTKNAQGKRGPETKGGMAGALLADHRRSGAQTATETTHHATDGTDTARSAQTLVQTDARMDAQPGLFVREQTDALAS